MDATPSTSTPFVIMKQVISTPQGTRLTKEGVVMQRTASGRLIEYRPDHISVSDDIELIDAMQEEPSEEPVSYRPDDISVLDVNEVQVLYEMQGEPSEEPSYRLEQFTVSDDLMLFDEIQEEPFEEPDDDEALAAAFADSGSEAEDAEEEDMPEEFEDAESVQSNTIFDWTDDYSLFRGAQEEFHESAGPKIEGTRPIELFTKLFDEPLIELIKEETNKFAESSISAYFETAADLPPKSRLHQWSETTVGELYRLIAVMIMMGMCVRGRVDEYWSAGTLGMPGFRTMIRKNRFLLLMRFLHFVDNDSISCCGPERKIAKIKPVLDHLNVAFKAAYTPRREVSIDESLLLWKGRLSWIQCIRTKAARFGIKSYELCEAVTGYVLNMIIYTGKGTLSTTVDHGFRSSTAKIVLKLFKDYLGKGHKLFMDNFYNSVTLARFLKSQRTDVVGTLNRRHVDCPQEIKALQERRLQRGTVVSRHCGDVSVVAWKDVRLVTTVSTRHNANMAPGRRAGQVKPEVIHEYNRYMGGVDLKDQKLSMYLLERKRGMKWYIKVFRRLINISVLNSYIIYCSNIGQNKKMTHRQFRYKLVEELCAQFGENSVSRAGPRRAQPCERLDRSVDHFPEHKEATRTSSKQIRYQRGRCARCWSKNLRKDCNIMCSHCKVFLCVGQCWKEFHTLDTL